MLQEWPKKGGFRETLRYLKLLQEWQEQSFQLSVSQAVGVQCAEFPVDPDETASGISHLCGMSHPAAASGWLPELGGITPERTSPRVLPRNTHFWWLPQPGGAGRIPVSAPGLSCPSAADRCVCPWEATPTPPCSSSSLSAGCCCRGRRNQRGRAVPWRGPGGVGAAGPGQVRAERRPAARMPGARTCSLAARSGLPRAVGAEALAEPPQGPEEPRVPGLRAQVSGARRGAQRASGRGARPPPARRGSGTWPRAAGRAGRRGGSAAARPFSRSRRASRKLGTLSAEGRNERGRAAGMLAVARRGSGCPELLLAAGLPGGPWLHSGNAPLRASRTPCPGWARAEPGPGRVWRGCSSFRRGRGTAGAPGGLACPCQDRLPVHPELVFTAPSAVGCDPPCCARRWCSHWRNSSFFAGACTGASKHRVVKPLYI